MEERKGEKTEGTVGRGDVTALLAAVEDVLGLHPVAPRDFAEMSEQVFRLTKSRLSPTTLMRLWGYVREEVNPRVSTLSILSRAVGRYDWNDWLASGRAAEAMPSYEVMSPHLNVEAALEPGDRVTLRWRPGRVCLVEYEGDGKFCVMESEKTRLNKGDRFRCGVIVEDEPLMIHGIEPAEGSTLPKNGCYVCGATHGVTFSLV